MTYRLTEEHIELYKLIKLLDLVASGAEAKILISEGHVYRNGLQELRKRAKIVRGDLIEIAELSIRVE